MFKNVPIPRYVQLADVMRHRIKRGVWPRGQVLPSIEKLMEEFGVSRVTVRQATQLLAGEGLLSPERGRGT
ncbi:MAG TPA: GntR family transcriptional regulator, partial [Afifellaceae bacterium]|nr:GntR family transcriptional regulator [Afifellaceae bacterium]